MHQDERKRIPRLHIVKGKFTGKNLLNSSLLESHCPEKSFFRIRLKETQRLKQLLWGKHARLYSKLTADLSCIAHVFWILQVCMVENCEDRGVFYLMPDNV